MRFGNFAAQKGGGPDGPMANMRRTKVGALLAALVLLLPLWALAEEDAIRVSSRSDPQSIVGEQDVTVTIKVYNTGAQDVTGEISLFNPEGLRVEQYEKGLAAGQTLTYSGLWHVTAEQISQRKILFYIRYPAPQAGAEPVLRQIPITIQTEAPAPQLTASYSVSPESARSGQKVTATYTLSNTGNIELRNIEIQNPGLSDKTLTAAALSVGERITLTDTITMGDQSRASEPKITYFAAGSDKALTLEDLGQRSIALAKDGLEAKLSVKDAASVYPGTPVEVTLSLKNTAEAALQNLSATLPDGTQILSLAELAAGRSYESKTLYTPEGDMTLTASVSGTIAGGEEIALETAAVDIRMQDLASALLLRVRAKAEDTVIYEEPGVLRFAIEVENVGQTDAATLTVTEAGTTVGTIPSLPSGEKRTLVVELALSMAGKVRFDVSGKDALGNERTYASPEMEIVYIEPTPAPTPAPTPTPVPPTPSPAPTATPVPSLSERIQAAVDPGVLTGIAVALAALITLILGGGALRSARRRKRLAEAVDTMVVSSDVRDSYGRRRRRRVQPPKEDQAADQIAPASELTEEEASAKHGERRRRSAPMQVPEGSTLRVAPEGLRPEMDEARPTDGATRVFNRLDEPEQTRRMPPVTPPGALTDGATTRIGQDQAKALRELAEAAQSGERRGLFGRKKKAKPVEEEEDLYE